MKAVHRAEAAAPSPREIKGNSLYRMQRWAAARGYETFLLGGGSKVGQRDGGPVLLPVTGEWWDDGYEVCHDKRAKYSIDGVKWFNFSAWRPTWTADCWYDIALVHRQSPLFEPLALRLAALPRRFCRSVEKGWYPSWIDRPVPSRLKCEAKKLWNECVDPDAAARRGRVG